MGVSSKTRKERKIIRENLSKLENAQRNHEHYTNYKIKENMNPETIRSNKKRALLQICHFIEKEIKDKKLVKTSDEAKAIYKKSGEILEKGLEVLILQELGYIDQIIEDFNNSKDEFIYKKVEETLEKIDLSTLKYNKAKNSVNVLYNVLKYYSVLIEKLKDLSLKADEQINESSYEKLFKNLAKADEHFELCKPSESKYTV